MCTAVTYRTKDHYFGRNLDYEVGYGERVVVTPRRFALRFRCMPQMRTHAAMIGIAAVSDGVPLYFDAVNEHGLGMAALNFPENAVYFAPQEEADNVAPFEFIPWILGQCQNLAQARRLLSRVNLAAIPFSEQLPLSPLHWMIADRDGALTVESMRDGLHVHDNPVGVLTNNPPFDYHLTNLCNYMHLSPHEPENSFSERLRLKPYSRGMGALGLPGDLSSASRFVKAAFVKENAVSGESEWESVNQFFHILASVAQQRGCVPRGEGEYEITRYSACCNTDKGVYYYTTYENSRIIGVDLQREPLDGEALRCYELIEEQEIWIQNRQESV